MSTFWKIEEKVGGGLYFVWDGIYSTREAAIAEARKVQGARVVQYRTGDWNMGAVRLLETGTI